MKLYTEEQVKRAMLEYTSYSNPTMVQVIDTLIPIELPSDEEISNERDKLPFSKHIDDGLYNEGINEGFFLGVEYMQQQILNQNNNL